MAKRYTVSDGKLVLTLEAAEEGGYVVTSPMEPALITQAENVADAFEMARDAMKTLTEGRAKLGSSAQRRRRRVG
jgi:predicted RNase H-like HicB family nuclease